jgi:hypothetical protein
VAAALVVLIGWLYLVTAAVYDGRAERQAARTPMLVEQGDHAFGRWLERADTHLQRQFTVVYLVPLRTTAPAPPGLPRWPGRGEVFLSPALLATGHGIVDRYGNLAGTIGEDGLTDAGEWLVYLRPVSDDSVDRLSNPTPTFVTGWGIPPTRDTAGVQALWFRDNRAHDRPALHMYLLITAALAVPVATLLAASRRRHIDRLGRALAVIKALGAPRGARMLVRIGDAALPCVAGATLGVLYAAASTVVDTMLPIVDYRVPATDLAPARLWLPMLWLAAVGLSFAVAALPGRGRSARRMSRARLSGVAGYVFALGVAVTAGGVVHGGAAGTAVYSIGTLVAVATLPLLAERIVATAAGWFHTIGGRRRKGPHRPTPTPRRTSDVGPTVVRVGAYLTLVLYVTVLAAAWFLPNERIRTEHERYGTQDSYALVEIRARWDEQEQAAFRARLPAATVMSVVRSGAENALVGDCRALATLGELTECPTSDLPASRVYRVRSAAGAALLDHAFLLTPDILVRTGTAAVPVDRLVGLVILQPARAGGVAAVKQAAYAAVSMPLVAQPGEPWVTGQTGALRSVQWIVLAGAGAVSITLIASLVAIWNITTGPRYIVRTTLLAMAALAASTIATLLAVGLRVLTSSGNVG